MSSPELKEEEEEEEVGYCFGPSATPRGAARAGSVSPSRRGCCRTVLPRDHQPLQHGECTRDLWLTDEGA